MNYKTKRFYHEKPLYKTVKNQTRKLRKVKKKQTGNLFPLLAAAIPAIIGAAKVAAPALALSAATGAISGAVNKAVQRGKGRKKRIKKIRRKKK